ncbi:hypothetical protein HDV02_002737 [Globomyces sp. JEL0801]|nr:hypothetical protein HDV02_002737 [Globomyces sp. JEL0801]
MISTGITLKTQAIHLIRNFLKDQGLETTLYALEMEAEEDLQISTPLPSKPLLGILEDLNQKPRDELMLAIDQFQALKPNVVERFKENALPIQLNTKITCIQVFQHIDMDSLIQQTEDLMMIDQDSKSIVEQDTVIPYILAGSTDKSIYLVRQDTGEIVDKYPIHQSPVLSISTYPLDPNYFVSTSMDGSTLLYHTLSKQILQKWNTHEKYVNKSLFSGDGEWFVTGSHDHSVNIYHRLQTQPLSYHFQQKLKFKGIIESLCFFNSESTLIVGIRNDHNLHYIHLPSMEETLVNMNANGDHWVSFSPMDLALSPNEKFLAVYTDSKAGRIIIYYNKTSNIVLNLWNTIVDEFSMPRLVWNPMGIRFKTHSRIIALLYFE